MRKITNECVCCGLPCIGDSCEYRNVVRYYCDDCQEEFNPNELYDVDGDELCEDCLKARFKTVAERGGE